MCFEIQSVKSQNMFSNTLLNLKMFIWAFFKKKNLWNIIMHVYTFDEKRVHHPLVDEENIEYKWFNYAITL